jgi:maleate isomerase
MSAQPQGKGLSTVKVTTPYQSDAGPAKYRVGLVALDSDVATEWDFHAMLPDDAAFYTSRIHCFNPITVENLRKLGPQVSAATKLLIPGQRLDVVAYSCTSGTVAFGYDEIAAQIRAGGRPDATVVTPITAAIAGFERLGIKKVSLLTPYVDSVNQAMRGFLEEHGIEVLNIGSFCLDDDIEMAELSPEAIHQAALEVCSPDADALFISCTAIRAVEVIERTELALGKPVLSAIQSLFWQSIRAAGYTLPIEGFGQLLRS